MPTQSKLPVLIAASIFLISGCAVSQDKPIDANDMQLVSGARYRMGTDPDELDRIRLATGLRSNEPLLAEVPSHFVDVGDFLIDTLDVTNQQFAEFVEASPAWSVGQIAASLHNGRYLEHWNGGQPPEDLLDHPVTFVTWQSAVAFCKWRDKRLPSEAEFEWAAQNGRTRDEYPWGNAPPSDDIVSWGGNGIDSTVPVGSYPPNERGLYDMSGNIWHFTSDPWIGSHAETMAETADIRTAAEGPRARRVVKGGSWGANAANLRVRYRDSHRPFDAREMVGFRCARTFNPG